MEKMNVSCDLKELADVGHRFVRWQKAAVHAMASIKSLKKVDDKVADNQAAEQTDIE